MRIRKVTKSPYMHHLLSRIRIRSSCWFVKKRFETLITSIHTSVQNLIELFPAPVIDQMRQLSSVETSSLASCEDVQLLQQACGDDDEMLSEALKQEVALRSHFVSDWDVSGQARVRIGDRSMSTGAWNSPTGPYASHMATRFVVLDSADVWIGNETMVGRHG